LQLVVAASLRLAGRWVMAGAATMTALIASFLLACGVAAATEVARGGTPWLWAACLGLAVAAIGYGAGAFELARASRDVP
jgi:hypothetical protein